MLCKIKILFISNFIFINCLISQPIQTNIWYFGTNAGVKFSGSTPIPLSDGQINNEEGSSVMCDNYGNLLFYTDGATIWDRNHNLMPNGIGLNGNISSTQTVIVRKPGNCKQFYIFYHSGQYNLRLYYSIVDLTLNGGLGDVISSTKNTFIYYPATEKITAVNHQNGTDVWVIFHEYNTNKFMSYLVTATGVNLPVNTNVGLIHANMIGYMKASHNGKKIATAITFNSNVRAELFDFNNSTGVISNPYTFNNWNAYGLEFSPNDSLLYVSTYWGTNKLYQINLSDNSFITISSVNNGNYDYCALQLAQDGKIYMARGNKNYLSAISNPNILGSGCSFVDNAITLAPGTFSFLGLPSFHQSLFDFNISNYIYSNVNCTKYNFLATPLNNIYDSLSWYFDDTFSGINNYSNIINPQHVFSNAGTFNVSLIIYYECYSDTIQQIIHVTNYGLDIDLGNDTTICTGSQFTINAGLNFSSYFWSTGDTTSSVETSNSGLYSITVSDNNGCIGSDSIFLNIAPNNNIIDLGNDTSICFGKQIYLNAGNGYLSYLWNTGENNSIISVSINNTYFVMAYDSNNCVTSDTIHISVIPNPIVDLGNDFYLCEGQSVILDAGANNDKYLWQDSSSNQTLSVNTHGIYWVVVKNNTGCIGSDTVIVNINSDSTDIIIPNVFTPNNDGFNDNFEIKYKIVSEAEIKIFNRWGNLVFESNNLSDFWDGTFNNEICHDGVYFWLLKYQLNCNNIFNEISKTGLVHLIR